MHDLTGWGRITCADSDAVFVTNRKLAPVSALTDLDGEFGAPIVFTEWGLPGEEESLLRNYQYPKSNKPCEHYIWIDVSETGEQE